jgi:hypothetical protein
MPLTAVVVIALVAVAVIGLALRVRLRPARRWPAPALPAVALLAALACLGFLALIWPFGDATHSASMTGAGLIVAAVLYASWNLAWTPRTLMAASFGALIGHTIFGLVGNADTLADRLFLGLITLITLFSFRHFTREDSDGRLERNSHKEDSGDARRFESLSAAQGPAR